MDKDMAIVAFQMIREFHARFGYGETKMNEEELLFYQSLLRTGAAHCKIVEQLLTAQHFKNKRELNALLGDQDGA